MANVDSFPLLKLPYLPLANVIKQFDSIHDRVYLATLSRRTAILVESLRDIKVLGLKLTVKKSSNLSVIYLDYGGIRQQEWIHKEHPNTLVFPFLESYHRLRKLIDTMFLIFGLSGFEELVVKKDEDRTMEISRLQNLLRNLNTIKFDRIYTSAFYEQALAAFPSVRNVSMTEKPNKQLLNKNLKILEFSSFILSDLELVNCESLQVSILFWEEFNLFIKSWIQGRMPRLKHVRIRNPPPMGRDIVFEGIQYREADKNREMIFKCYSLNLGDPENTVVRGGLDIESKNGARATVSVQKEEQRFDSWNMNVWD